MGQLSGEATPHSSRLRVTLICSGRAPGLSYLLDSDSNRGILYDLAGCVTSEPECLERHRLAAAGVPCVVRDLRDFYARRNASIRDMKVRRDYDRELLATLDSFRPDLVVLCGYLYIVTAPLLEPFPGRVVNVHDSDLCVTDSTGRPKYGGLHAVREAVLAGEVATRSTVHAVTNELDGGPPLVRSWPFEVHRPLVAAAVASSAIDVIKAYAYAHREWMMHASWGPLLAKTFELLARNQVEIGDGVAAVGGSPGPWNLSAQDSAITTARGSRLESVGGS